MSVEYIREMAFLQEVKAAGQVWGSPRSQKDRLIDMPLLPSVVPVWQGSQVEGQL